MVSFEEKYWFVWLVAVLIAALGAAVFLYFQRKSDEFTPSQRIILAILRFLGFFLVASLLLTPLIKNLNKFSNQPTIVVAYDNSNSLIANRDSLQTKTTVTNIKKQLESTLKDKSNYFEYSFGEKPRQQAKFNFDDKKSNYEELISTISQNHFNEQLNALILIGDGIYNQGTNPVNLTHQINFPIYTVGLGDTTQTVDARIQNVVVNRTAFSGNRFLVMVEAQFSKMQGKTIKLAIANKNGEIISTIVKPANNDYYFSHEFLLDARNKGLKHFIATVDVQPNEINRKNNTARFVVNVLDSKQKILLLSEGPHPDMGAIKNTLEEPKNYEVSIVYEAPYPTNIKDYNLLIFNQMPTVKKSLSKVIEEAKKHKTPTLYIIGNKTFLPQLNTLAQGINIEALAGSSEQATAYLHDKFALFTLSDETKELLPQFPPLQVPFANFVVENDIETMLYQRIKNIETTKPLLAMGTFQQRKVGFIMGSGIWRWRLFNYYQNQSHEQFNELINKIAQYLVLKQNEDNFMIDFKSIYDEIDDIKMWAEVYNESYEKINSEEINITIKNRKGDEYSYVFDTSGSQYQLNAGKLPVGDYTFKAKVKIGKKEYFETGEFAVMPVDLEDIVTQANHQMLFQLAENSGGKFYHPNQIKQLINSLDKENKLQTTNYFTEITNHLINLKWIFFIILLLMSLEWFLRKYWGVY